MAPHVDREGSEVGRCRSDEPPGHLGQLELVDVQVPDGCGQIAEPLEGRLPVTPKLWWQDGPSELEGRPGPPDCHPEVVQELGVHVVQHTLDVVVDRREELAQLADEQGRGRPLRIDDGRLRPLLGAGLLVGFHQLEGPEQPVRPLGLGVIPAQGVDGDPG
jgi:hypothetical protein